jgi:hypothetical protein
VPDSVGGTWAAGGRPGRGRDDVARAGEQAGAVLRVPVSWGRVGRCCWAGCGGSSGAMLTVAELGGSSLMPPPADDLPGKTGPVGADNPATVADLMSCVG